MIVLVVLIVAVFAVGIGIASYSFTSLSPMRGIMIEKVDWNSSTGQIIAYIRNLERSDLSVKEVYVNGTLDDKATLVPQVLQPNETAEITLTETYAIMPTQVTVEIRTELSWVSRRMTFIHFEMLRVYWNETTERIRVLVENTGEYPAVNFENVYVNGTIDYSAIIAQKTFQYARYRIYEVSLSGTYTSKPSKLDLTITTTDGASFQLSSPFNRGHDIMTISMIRWNQSTGQIKFLVYVPSASFLEGEQDLNFEGIYINGELDESPVITRVYSETYEVTLSKTYATCPSQATVKVVTDFGAFGVESDYDLTDTLPSGFQTNLIVTSVQFSPGYITIGTRNVGKEQMTVSKVLVNDVEQAVVPFTLKVQEEHSVVISYQWVSRSEYAVQLISSDGRQSFPRSEFAP